MPNITLTVEADVLKKVRKIAVDQNTSLNALVRSFLHQVAARGDLATKEIVARLKTSFDKTTIRVGQRTWSRDDLHAR